MPGRQVTGLATKNVPQKRKRSISRALDAFALAEHEVPEITEVRKTRLGHVETDGHKRRRDDSDEGSEGQENTSRLHKLRRSEKRYQDGGVESGSDSEGNQWTTGVVGSEDDSSLDSDEAMGESDEEKFKNFKFRGSSSVKHGGRRSPNTAPDRLNELQDDEIDLDEGSGRENGSDAESEDFAANAVDLATALDADSDEENISPKEKRSKGTSSGRPTPPSELEHSDDSRSTELSLSELDDDDYPGEDKYGALQSLISSMDNGDSSKGLSKSQFDLAQEALPPSEYGVNPKQKLTIADVLPTVTDPTFRRSLKLMADNGKNSTKVGKGVPGKLSVPLPKRQQDRLDRAAAFEKSKETLSRWTDTVKHNRRAEHLVFPLLDRDVESAKNMKRMLPITDSRQVTVLESTIHDLLAQSGLAADGKTQDSQIQEMEDLATNKMPIEEVKARRAELRRARELLFREEIRAKRIKKIKSKSYRRVHRKERDKNLLRDREALAAAGLVSPSDEQERIDRQRAEERMGQRHRESRWAKGVKGISRAAWDEDARQGMTDMARRDEELRRRMQGKDVQGEELLESDSQSSDEASEEDEDAFAGRMKSKLDKLDREPDENESRLSSMRFMQKAEAARKAQNDEAVEQLRKELEGGAPQEDSEGEAQGRRRYGPQKDTKERIKIVNKPLNEFEERLDSDEERGTGQNWDDQADEVEITVNKPSAEGRRSAEDSRQPYKGPRKLPDKEKVEVVENPWLVSAKKPSKAKSATEDSLIISTTPELSSRTSMPSNAPRLSAHAQNGDASDGSEASFSGFSPPPSTPLTDNQALIRQAFAADDVLAEESFAAEKAALAAEEEPSKPGSNSLPGWGTWVGPALSKRDKREAKRAPTANRTGASNSNGSIKFAKSTEGVPAEKRKDRNLQKVIISEKRTPKSAKYLASELPHPFESRAQYERSLRLPMGPEFTTKETFQGMTKPRVLLKPGVVAPMRKPLM